MLDGEVSDILNNDVMQLPDDHLCNLLLFGSLKFNKIANRMILDATVRFLVKANRFKNLFRRTINQTALPLHLCLCCLFCICVVLILYKLIINLLCLG